MSNNRTAVVRMRPEPVSNGLTLWRCPVCPILIPAWGWVASVGVHERAHVVAGDAERLHTERIVDNETHGE